MVIRSVDNPFEFIPESRRSDHTDGLFVHDQVKEAGNYTLLSDENPVQGLSFNFNREESEMGFKTNAEIQSWIADNRLKNVQLIEEGGQVFTEKISQINQGISLWKWFVLAALLFLLVEVILLRVLKN